MKKRPFIYPNSRYLSYYNRFRRLYFRIKRFLSEGLFFQLSLFERTRLLNKFKLFYKRLLKEQFSLGIKVAGITLAFTLICSAVNAQGTYIEKTGEENPLGGKLNPFSGLLMGEKIAPAFVDIDNDGDKDLFVGDTLGTIKYFKNAGNNTFQLQAGSNNPFNGVDVGSDAKPAFVDIDEDGDLDCFIGEYDGTINYYRNDGDVSGPVFNLVSGADNPLNGIDVGYNSAPAFTDIDNDSDLDLFIGVKYGFIKYYENTSEGENISFIERTGEDNPADSLFDFSSTVAFSDIDDDGDFDFFMGDKYGFIRQFENTGNASAAVFEEKEGLNNIFFDEDMGFNSTPVFIDFDGDSDFDALIGNREGKLNYYNNEGTPGSPEFVMYQPIDVGWLAQPAFADLDDDGDMDVIIGNYFGTIDYYRNDGNENAPNFRKAKGIDNPFYGDTIKEYWIKPCLVNINSNYDSDFDAFIGTDAGKMKYYINYGTADLPVFIEQTSIYNPFNSVNLGNKINPAFVDIDNDNDQDVFFGYYDGTVKYYENMTEEENIVFAVRTDEDNPFNGLDPGTSFADPAFCDIDGDTDFDAAIGTYSGQEITYFENTGTPENPVFVERSGPANPFDGIEDYYPCPVFVDIDNDTDFDLFVGCYHGEIRYFESNWPPVVAHEIPNQNPLVNQPFSYTVPGNAFYDHDIGDELVYVSTLMDGNPLPGWLTFNPSTRQYSGTATVAGTLNIKIVATDIAGHSVFDVFNIIVTEEPLSIGMQETAKLDIYPVPASDFLNIRLTDLEPGMVDIEILDISGRILVTGRFNYKGGEFETGINVSSLSGGIYYINIRRGGSIINKKFIVN
jgi:hypothetical protein